VPLPLVFLSKEKRDARPASRFRMEVPCGVTLVTPQYLDVHPVFGPRRRGLEGLGPDLDACPS